MRLAVKIRQSGGTGWSWVKPAIVMWLAALVFTGVCYALWTRKIDVHAERGPLELVQSALWCIAAVVTATAVVRGRNWRDRASAVWLCALAIIAGARELDLHEALQKGVAGMPEVHFRTDWLLDGAQPLGPKVALVAVLAVLGLALAVPPLTMRAPTLRLMRVGDNPTWLLMACFAFLGAGYASDDLLGRGRLGIHYEVTQGIEEVFELCGVLAFVLAAWYELRFPLSGRVAALTKADGEASAVHVDAGGPVATSAKQ